MRSRLQAHLGSIAARLVKALHPWRSRLVSTSKNDPMESMGTRRLRVLKLTGENGRRKSVVLGHVSEYTGASAPPLKSDA